MVVHSNGPPWLALIFIGSSGCGAAGCPTLSWRPGPGGRLGVVANKDFHAGGWRIGGKSRDGFIAKNLGCIQETNENHESDYEKYYRY